ncbi:MAG: hypothetical protein L3J08_05500 [Flavobacteriaceae bacterium]|nr:hypothetical protein [Flavobacteriaceae bacterium]
MKDKALLYTIILAFFFISCVKKEVQLPIIEIEGIHEIQNHSSIWIFFETDKQDTLAVLNKNNKLLNTHWIYNIDKRLPMHKIVPLLQKMQKNRNKDSMHKKEGMLNYFSYADIASNNVSLIDFNPIKFISSKKESENSLKNLSENLTLKLEIRENGLILNQLEIKTDQLIQKINNFIINDSLPKPKILLSYNGNISYQNYLSTKAILSKAKIEVNQTEYIFNLK